MPNNKKTNDMKKLLILAVCAMAAMISCKQKGQTAPTEGMIDSATVAVIDSILEENDTTPMPMFLMGEDAQYALMLYWENLEEPKKNEEYPEYFEAEHQRLTLQDMFRRNKEQYTNMLMDDKFVKIKFIDEVLKDPDGDTPSIGEIHRKEIPSLCARFDFANPKDKKKTEYGYNWGTVIVTDAYLQSRKLLPIKSFDYEWDKEDPLPATVVKQLEQRYGMQAMRSELMCSIGDSCQYGSIQFKGEYKNGPKEGYNDERKCALALDVIICGDKVYANEQYGSMFSETDYSWNADDEGRYVGCNLLAAFEGPKGLELCYYRGAPESSTVGMFYLREGKLIEHEYEGYHNMVDEEIPVWKSDIAEMQKLYLADDPHSHKSIELAKWAHCHIDFENEWIWLRDKENKNGAFFIRKDGKFKLIDVENVHQKPSRAEKDGVSYLKFGGSAGGPSYQHIIYAYKGGERLWKLFVLEIYGEISECMLNDKDISKEEGKAYFDKVPEGQEINAWFKDIDEKAGSGE